MGGGVDVMLHGGAPSVGHSYQIATLAALQFRAFLLQPRRETKLNTVATAR
jgi:hypothetical protein